MPNLLVFGSQEQEKIVAQSKPMQVLSINNQESNAMLLEQFGNLSL